MAEPPRPPGFWRALALASELGYVIAVPLVLLAAGGRFADRRFGTSPVLLFVGVLLAIVISSTWIARKVRGCIQP